MRETEAKLADAAEKLQEKYAHGPGPLSDEEVLAAIEDVAEPLRDAPVQTFVPLIAENLARDRLQDRADEVMGDDRVALTETPGDVTSAPPGPADPADPPRR